MPDRLPPPPSVTEEELAAIGDRVQLGLATAADAGVLHADLMDLRVRFQILVEAAALLSGQLGAIVGRAELGLVLSRAGLRVHRQALDDADDLVALALNTTTEELRNGRDH